MPLLSVVLIRTSLIYLLTGFSLGTLLLWQKASLMPLEVWRFLPVHLELLTYGWIVQLVFGVAYWILPRFNTSPVRGNQWFVWITFFSLNSGILLMGLNGFLPNPDLWALVGRGFELLAVLSFGLNIWSRIKPFAV